MTKDTQNASGAVCNEPLETAFERLSSFMGGDHDWADEAEEDLGRWLPPPQTRGPKDP